MERRDIFIYIGYQSSISKHFKVVGHYFYYSFKHKHKIDYLCIICRVSKPFLGNVEKDKIGLRLFIPNSHFKITHMPTILVKSVGTLEHLQALT